MNVLGVNLDTNEEGRRLRDGGAALIADGKIVVAIAEERLSRIKADGGYRNSLPYCLQYHGLQVDDLDAIVVSSCVDFARSDQDSWGFRGVEPSRVHYIPGHHLSHAYSCYMVSPYDEALICVADAGGTILEGDRTDRREWWKLRREQNSYYIGRGNEIEPIGYDCDEPNAAGFGEVYRAFTYYLGWHSYLYSGTTMALSAYGDPERFAGVDLFRTKGDRIYSLVRNEPVDPIGMIQRFAEETGVDFGSPREPGAPIEDMHRDLARLVQDQLEKALIEKITTLSHRYGIRNLCMAGGVALNCVVNSKLLEQTPIEGLFVVPAAGDTGQCLGNALYGYHAIGGRSKKLERFSPYLGREYPESKEVVDAWLADSGADCEIVETDDYFHEVATLISQGYIVGWFHGRSEFGPRALGARSILADPRYDSVQDRLLSVKQRENFRPFAPSVLLEHAKEYFDLPAPESPYMLLTAKVKPYKRRLVPNVVHVDQTSRLQTVSPEDNADFYRLVQEYKKITRIPVILNTSFNGRGRPIVEAPSDALKEFQILDLDVLAIEGCLIKRKWAEERIIRVIEEARREPVELSELKVRSYDLSSITAEQLVGLLARDFPDIELIPRDRLGLFRSYVELLRAGLKTTTIRYRGGDISYPSSSVLEVLDTGVGGEQDRDPQLVGSLRVTGLTVKPYGLLNDEDAMRDGFASREELLEALFTIYGPIEPHEYVSIFVIHLLDDRC